MPIRLVLANDSPLVLAGLQGMLAPHAERVELVGRVLAPEEGGALGPLPEADVCLLDAFGREAGGLRAVAALVARRPPFRVVVFTEARDPRVLLEALRLGAAGYLLKSTTADTLVEDLERVAAGEVVVDRELASAVAVAAADRSGKARTAGLTGREVEVLALLAEGLSSGAIASELSVSSETVRSHLKRIYQKLGVGGRAGAVTAAWRQGLLTGSTNGEQGNHH